MPRGKQCRPQCRLSPNCGYLSTRCLCNQFKEGFNVDICLSEAAFEKKKILFIIHLLSCKNTIEMGLHKLPSITTLVGSTIHEGASDMKANGLRKNDDFLEATK